MPKTLTDLQTDRERINAAEAKAAFESALAETCEKSALVQAAQATRALLLRLMDKLPDILLEAIGDETSETQVHYLLSDCLHTEILQLLAQIPAATAALPMFGEAFKRGCKPRELLTVSKWADKHRWIESGSNMRGQWKTSLTPYLREIMDSLSEHSPVREVVFMKSSGVGGTESLYNWIGYTMHHLQNADMLVVQPSLELRDRSFNPRLMKMISESPVLKELVSSAARNKSNRADLLEYGAFGRIVKAGANSADSLRSEHLPYVVCDEVDAYKWDIEGEGDPLLLIENRQRTFTRAKTFLISTPTMEGKSRIAQKYKASDMRRYYVPCPHCGELQVLEKGDRETPYGLKWRKNLTNPAEVDAVWYVCRHNACIIEEGNKAEMLANGIWIAEKPEVKEIRGYHISALYAPPGLGLGWKKIVEKWLSVQGDTSSIKGFVNTYLGEVSTEDGEDISDVPLILRIEDYKNPPILAITAGVDIQKDRIEITIVGWGEHEEAWVISHEIAVGDTAQPEVWEELQEILHQHKVEIAAIDSGYQTSMVYAFCEKRKWCVPIKGIEGAGRPLVEDERKRRQRLRVKRKKGMPVEPLGVDQGKLLIYSRLKMTEIGTGYIHFPKHDSIDEEYFKQLAAEKYQQKKRAGRPVFEWVKLRPRNEALDCMLYALAGLRLANFDMAARAAKKVHTVPQAPAAQRALPKRRVVRRV